MGFSRNGQDLHEVVKEGRYPTALQMVNTCPGNEDLSCVKNIHSEVFLNPSRYREFLEYTREQDPELAQWFELPLPHEFEAVHGTAEALRILEWCSRANDPPAHVEEIRQSIIEGQYDSLIEEIRKLGSPRLRSWIGVR